MCDQRKSLSQVEHKGNFGKYLKRTCLKNVLTVRVIALKFAKFIVSSSSPDFGLSGFEGVGLPTSALFDALRETGSPLLRDDLVPSGSSVF